jgi:hypothetical protein
VLLLEALLVALADPLDVAAAVALAEPLADDDPLEADADVAASAC